MELSKGCGGPEGSAGSSFVTLSPFLVLALPFSTLVAFTLLPTLPLQALSAESLVTDHAVVDRVVATAFVTPMAKSAGEADVHESSLSLGRLWSLRVPCMSRGWPDSASGPSLALALRKSLGHLRAVVGMVTERAAVVAHE